VPTRDGTPHTASSLSQWREEVRGTRDSEHRQAAQGRQCLQRLLASHKRDLKEGR
jgi:hypothetical protein